MLGNKNEFIIHNPIQTLDQLFAVRQNEAKKSDGRLSFRRARRSAGGRRTACGRRAWRGLIHKGALAGPTGTAGNNGGRDGISIEATRWREIALSIVPMSSGAMRGEPAVPTATRKDASGWNDTGP
jgi:hypothetical protein